MEIFQLQKNLQQKADSTAPKPSKSTTKSKDKIALPSDTKTNKDIGLTVRVEINLPTDGSKETYDNIFKSIKENLIND